MSKVYDARYYEEYPFTIRKTETDDTAMARRIAERLVDNEYGARKYRAYVIIRATVPNPLPRKLPARFPVHPPTDIGWTHKRKNTFGIAIGKREPNARQRAVDWIASTLLRGYAVFVDVSGHSLKGGDYQEDVDAFLRQQDQC